MQAGCRSRSAAGGRLLGSHEDRDADGIAIGIDVRLLGQNTRRTHSGVTEANCGDFLDQGLLEIEMPSGREGGDPLAQEIIIDDRLDHIGTRSNRAIDIEVDVHEQSLRCLLEVVNADRAIDAEVAKKDTAHPLEQQIVHRGSAPTRPSNCTSESRRCRLSPPSIVITCPLKDGVSRMNRTAWTISATVGPYPSGVLPCALSKLSSVILPLGRMRPGA